MDYPTRRQHRGRLAPVAGMTLIELMIVVAIASILATIAYPSYREHVIRTHRSEAKAELLQTQQALEKCFTRLHTYDGCNLIDHTTASGRYFIDISPLGQTFTVTAAPRGSQIGDVDCGTLSIDQRGRKGKTGGASMEACWQR